MSLRVTAIPVTLNGIQLPLARAGTDKMARLVAKVTQPLVEISPSCRTSGSRGSIGAEWKLGRPCPTIVWTCCAVCCCCEVSCSICCCSCCCVCNICDNTVSDAEALDTGTWDHDSPTCSDCDWSTQVVQTRILRLCSSSSRSNRSASPSSGRRGDPLMPE